MNSAQRQQIERMFEGNARTAAALFERHPAAELTRRPSETSWSAAEAVAHLTLTAAAAAPLVEAAVADLRSRGRLSQARSPEEERTP